MNTDAFECYRCRNLDWFRWKRFRKNFIGIEICHYGTVNCRVLRYKRHLLEWHFLFKIKDTRDTLFWWFFLEWTRLEKILDPRNKSTFTWASSYWHFSHSAILFAHAFGNCWQGFVVQIFWDVIPQKFFWIKTLLQEFVCSLYFGMTFQTNLFRQRVILRDLKSLKAKKTLWKFFKTNNKTNL